jgi:hypothetical protein
MQNELLSGPVFSRRFVLEHQCQESVGHAHNYDHSTLVLRGRILVISHEHRGEELIEVGRQEYGWGERCPMPAHRHHTIKALEPNTVYDCEFSHRDFDGLVSQRYVGNQQAYV